MPYEPRRTVGEGRALEGSKGQNRPFGSGADPWMVDGTHADRRFDLLSLIPLLAIVALVCLVGALVWLVNRSDVERARTKLATDALWVEQTLHFQLSVDEDMLARMALDTLGDTAPDLLETRARLHMAANPEVLSVNWYDQSGSLVRAIPGKASPSDQALIAMVAGTQSVSARPIYGQIRGNSVSLAMHPREDGGIVTATISLPLLLERHIPWWIAEQYAVQLSDSQNRVLAERAKRDPDPANAMHSISFDPPLSGTLLRIAPYAVPTTFANTLILAAIAGLAGFAILALLALYRNASRRRHAELRLRGEMAFRRSMEESLTVGLRAKDHEGRILYVNSAFCNLVGWSSDDLVGRIPPMPYWAPDSLEETLARQQALADGGARSQSFETRFRHRDGAEIDVQVFEAPLIDAKGAHRGWMGSVIDITDAKHAARLARAQDESLARTGRLVTLGEMASTLAHELNQPLSAIASYAAGGLNLMQQPDPDASLLKTAFEKMQVQARRAGQIIRGIQDFVKKREPRFAGLDLSDVIQETVGFLAADARESRVRIVVDVEPTKPVWADQILLEQVLINLIRNGVEAMPEHRRNGETLTVSLRASPGGGATIEVMDQGTGIAPEVANRLFDPFTSTKAEGMGMGLNICRSIIELHRGQLTHQPRPGGGTIFTITLPAVSGTLEGWVA